MKNTKITSFLYSVVFFLSMLGITSCVGEDHIKQGEGDEIRFQVTLGGEEAAAKSANALRAKPVDPNAAPVTVAATEAEKYITTDKNCIAFLFHADSKAFVKYVEFSRPQGSSTPFTLKPGIKGNFVMKLVFNLNETDYNNLKNLKVGTTRQLDDALVKTPLRDGSNGAHFVMTSDYVNVNNESGAITLPDIPLHRLAARIDIENHFRSLKITRVIVDNRYTESLLGLGNRNGMPKDKNLKQESGKAYTFPIDGNLLSSTIYTYENLNTAAKNLKITIEGTFKDKAIKTSFALENTPIRRNHIYHINIEKNPADFYEPIEHNITVADWKDGATLNIPSNTVVETGENPEIKITFINKENRETDITNQSTFSLGRRRCKVRFDVTTYSGTTQVECIENAEYLPKKQAGNTRLDVMGHEGYEITDEVLQMKDGKTVKRFVLSFPANLSRRNQSFTFAVKNAVTKENIKTIKLTQPSRPDLPLEFMTQYNMYIPDYRGWTLYMIEPTHKKGVPITSFTGRHPGSAEESAQLYRSYYDYSTYDNHYTKYNAVYIWDKKTRSFILRPPTYNLGSIEEWAGIIPPQVPEPGKELYRFNFMLNANNAAFQPDRNLGWSCDVNGIKEDFKLPNESSVRTGYGAKYLNVKGSDGLGTVYALRYMKDNSNPDEKNLMLCALRYKLCWFGDDEYPHQNKYLLITCRYLGPDYDLESDDPFDQKDLKKISEMPNNFWNPKTNTIDNSVPALGDVVMTRIISLLYYTRTDGYDTLYHTSSSQNGYYYTVWMYESKMNSNHIHTPLNDTKGFIRLFCRNPLVDDSETDY